MLKSLYLILIVFMLAVACVEDPPVEASAEAALRSKFIPIDSINRLDDRLYINEAQIEVKNIEIDYYDSLENAGEGDYTNEIEVLNLELDSLQDIRAELSSIINSLTRGDIQLDFIKAAGSDGELTFEFTQQFYGLPLNSNAAQSTFMIGYGSYYSETTFSYDVETLYEERVVRLRGFNINPLRNTFDSLKINCPADTCTTDEILVTFYF